ncbi:hypothetical protein TNCV_3449451 [Trichonephila clavipes]|nr:hypothetical protein TNCV_3449451 [Trichonephila clavipes]
MSRRPKSLSSMNLDSSVKSTESHRCLVQETCSLGQVKWALLCRLLREWSATSRGTEILLLRAERAIKRSPAGVVARGRPGHVSWTQMLRFNIDSRDGGPHYETH